jgi:hypothetical protein
MPFLNAKRIAFALQFTPIFANSRVVWFLIVFSLTSKRFAISLFESPSHIAVSTLSSLGLSLFAQTTQLLSLIASSFMDFSSVIAIESVAALRAWESRIARLADFTHTVAVVVGIELHRDHSVATFMSLCASLMCMF